MDTEEKVSSEYDVVRNMVELAQKNGLEAEVMMSFAGYVKEGHSFCDSAGLALYDWDI